MKKKYLIVIAAVLAAALLFAACGSQTDEGKWQDVVSSMATGETPGAISPAPGTQAVQTNESTISVSTTETVTASPDMAHIQMGVRTEGGSADDALQQNNRIVDSFLAAVKAQGLTDDDIKTSYINMYQDYEDASKFIVENTFELTIRDIDSIGAVIDAAVGAGANTAYYLSFDVSDRDAKYMEALQNAMQSVNEKADTLAQAGGYTIVRPLSIQEAGSSSFYNEMIPMEAETAAADTGRAMQVMPSDIEISATVSGTYVIE